MKTVKWIAFAALLFFVIFLGVNQFRSPQGITQNALQPSPPKPTTPPKPASKIYGVNISGAEFGPENLPGVRNKDYIYPRNNSEYQYFAQKNIRVIRLPIRWERIQHEAFGPLNGPDINEIKKVFAVANQNNMKIILDLHNFARYYNQALTAKDAGKLGDVWTKLALAFKNDPALYGYELMNEPHDLPGGSATWTSIAQSVTNEIRKVDKQTLIIVPGYNWQRAADWAQNNPKLPINNPENNIVYSAHVYFDSNHSGRYTKSFEEDNRETQVGVTESEDFRNWLKTNNVQGIFTEFGVPGNDQSWLRAMDLFLESIHNDPVVTGAFYWSAGPWWKNYVLSIEPKNGADRPQMQILQKYTSR